MTIVKTSSVFCDVGSARCRGWTAQVTDNQGGAREARRQARSEGWKRIDGQDVCPNCPPTVAAVAEVGRGR